MNIPSAGTYTFKLLYFEDGAMLDAIFISTNGAGPPGAPPPPCSSSGATVDNMIIYDQLPANSIYFSTIPWSGWGAQYTYDDPPADQTFTSLDYNNMPPPVSSNVRWIRWTNSSPTTETGLMTYQVIIK